MISGQRVRRGLLLSALTAMGLTSPGANFSCGGTATVGALVAGGSGGSGLVAANDAGAEATIAGSPSGDTNQPQAGASTIDGVTGNAGRDALAANARIAGSGGVGTAGAAGGGAASSTSSAGATQTSVVALVQSAVANAADLTEDDINQMVAQAVQAAGGFDFIADGSRVVLKPNLLTPYTSCWSAGTALAQHVNGVTTDYRVTKAVALLVRQRNPTGSVVVMEGSNRNTREAFRLLGYTQENFGTLVNEFIALEGTGCSSRDDPSLVERSSRNGGRYWVNQRYVDADVVISIGALKTHSRTGVTGCVKNLGIGATPSARYSVSTNDADCTRNMSQASLAGYIDHARAPLADFITEFYGIRPADFAVLDALQGLQHGPCTPNAPDSDRKNLRLILAGRNAVALDATASRIMACDPERVLYLSRLNELGFGPVRSDAIDVRGRRMGSDLPLTLDQVRQVFVSGVTDVCTE